MQANNIWFLYTRDIHAKYLSVRVPGRLVSHWGPGTGRCGPFPVVTGQELAARACPSAPDRSRQREGTGAFPAPDIRHLPEDWDMLRPGWDIG